MFDLIGRTFGKSPTWDDLRVPVTATLAGGSNPPELVRFKGLGVDPAYAGSKSEYHK